MAELHSKRTTVVRNSQGLHVRPAEVVARAAMRYECHISLELEGHKIDAKSILHIMTLGAQQGSEVTIEARGADAQEAVEKISELIGGDFGCDDNETVTQEQAG
jgi:phosphotransferase system HPr (HPr) family protein